MRIDIDRLAQSDDPYLYWHKYKSNNPYLGTTGYISLREFLAHAQSELSQGSRDVLRNAERHATDLIALKWKSRTYSGPCVWCFADVTTDLIESTEEAASAVTLVHPGECATLWQLLSERLGVGGANDCPEEREAVKRRYNSAKAELSRAAVELSDRQLRGLNDAHDWNRASKSRESAPPTEALQAWPEAVSTPSQCSRLYPDPGRAQPSSRFC